MSYQNHRITNLKYLTKEINRHGALAVIIFGTAGNFLSLITWNDRSFQNNSYAIYFWWSSLSSIIFIWSGLLTRVLEGYVLNYFLHTFIENLNGC